MATVNFPMNSRSRGRALVYLAAVICMLVLAGTPAAASAGSSAVHNQASRQAACASHTTVGALGHEGGMLSLRGHDGSAQAVAAILHAKGNRIMLMREGYVAYASSECLGVDGGLMGVGK